MVVQVGANDGVRADPLRSYILQHHPRGVLVEPLPDMFESLKANYAGEPQLAFENAAIALEDGERELFRFALDAPVADYMHGMATFDERKIRAIARARGLDGYVQKVKVPAMTFQSLVTKHRIDKISLLQIDAEGFDFEVIKMAIASATLPEVINYEFVNLTLKDRVESCKLLAERGYFFVHGVEDTLAIRGEWPRPPLGSPVGNVS